MHSLHAFRRVFSGYYFVKCTCAVKLTTNLYFTRQPCCTVSMLSASFIRQLRHVTVPQCGGCHNIWYFISCWNTKDIALYKYQGVPQLSRVLHAIHKICCNDARKCQASVKIVIINNLQSIQHDTYFSCIQHTLITAFEHNARLHWCRILQNPYKVQWTTVCKRSKYDKQSQ